MLSWVEHEKSFITLGPDLQITLDMYVIWNPVICRHIHSMWNVGSDQEMDWICPQFTELHKT